MPIEDGQGPWNRPLAMEDLELLHNYTTRTVSSLLPDEELSTIYTEGYVQLGFSKHYVMHSILAISALHLYSQDRTRTELFSRATSLQSGALRLAQPHIANLSEEHSIGLFVFASFTAVFSLAEVMLNPYEKWQERDPIDELINCAQLSKGVQTVIAPFWENIRHSWLGPLFHSEDNRDELLPRLKQDFPMLLTMRSLALEQETVEQQNACLQAVDKLFLYLSIVLSSPGGGVTPKYQTKSRHIMSWLVELHGCVLDLLAERNVFTLILMAYFAALVHERDFMWNMAGWPEVLINHIDGLLDSVEDRDVLLAWPKERVLGKSSQ